MRVACTHILAANVCYCLYVTLANAGPNGLPLVSLSKARLQHHEIKRTIKTSPNTKEEQKYKKERTRSLNLVMIIPYKLVVFHG